MANISKNLQKELKFFLQTIEAEQELTIKRYVLTLQKSRNRGMGKEELRRILNTPAVLLGWDALRNKIRAETAGFINHMSRLGYYEGLRDG